METPHPDPRPERLQIRVEGRRWATALLIGANIAAFAWTLLQGGGLLEVDVETALALGANHGPLVVEGQWWRVVASTFLHGGILHLLFNMWALRVLGPLLESFYGGAAFLLLFVISAAGASLCSIAVHPVGISLGASGGVFALLGAEVAFFLRHRREMPESLFRGQMRSILMLIGINVVLGLSVPQIDNAAHMGGLVLGAVGGVALDRGLRDAPGLSPRRWLGVLFLAALLAPLAWAVTWSVARAEATAGAPALDRVRAALERGDWGAARDAASLVLETDAASYPARVLRAVAQLELGDLDAALADADRALALDAGSGAAHWVRVHALYRQSRWAEAAEAGRSLAEAGHAEGVVWRWLARVRLGQRADADRELAGSLRRRSGGEGTLERLVAAHFVGELGLEDLVAQSMRTGEHPRVSEARALALAGEMRLVEGDRAGALELFRRAAALDAPAGSSEEQDLAARRIAELTREPR